MFDDLARGQAEALEEIYEAAASSVFGLALWRTGSREDAGDVVQEVFVRLVEQRLRFARAGAAGCNAQGLGSNSLQCSRK